MKEISANTKRNERYNIDFQKIEKTCITVKGMKSYIYQLK